jgi:hypothetical protein
MPILPNRIRWLAFFAVFCVAWFNAAVGRPAETLSALKRTVLVLHGDRLSIPAVKITEQGLTAGVHSKNGMSPRAEFLGKPQCYIGTQACGISTPV